ncbi:MAG TPA: H-NS histone family protein [Aquabacterium sp.]|nr:H-NS histone family protein [Aquabacterium sp.]HQC96215.1 H-NS histone family protein [Aquabacterium sp.]
MAKTYAQIQAQIRKLQQDAEALKAKEVAGVVARIQAAIAHYGLTPADLFGKTAGPVRRQPAARTAAKADKAPKAPKAARAPSPAKYQDDAGHQWSGVGKRPNWFKAALADGKTAEDLLVNKPAS